MKTLWKICKLVIMLLLTGVIVWTVLYFTVPKVKDWTNDKVFKIDQSKDDEEKKQLRAENEDLKKQINSLTTEATTVSAELTNVKDQLTAKTTALETATSEKQELTSKVSKLEQKVSELETSGAATQTELEAKKQELATAQTSLQEKTAEVETLTAEKQTLENQKTTLESQLAEKQNQIQTLQARVTELETQLNPGEEGYTYEELKIFSAGHMTKVSLNNDYLIMSNYFSQYSIWLLKNNKYVKLTFSSSDNCYAYKFGDKDLFLDLTTSHLVDKNGNIENIDTSNIFEKYIDYSTYFYDLQKIDDNSFFLIGNKKIKKVNLTTKTIESFDITLSDTNGIIYFSDENIIFLRYNSDYYFYNFNTNTETKSDVGLFEERLIKVGENKYLCGLNTLYLFDLSNLTFTELKKSFNVENVYSHVFDNGNVLIGTNSFSGLFLYNKETSTIEQISDKTRGLYFLKTNSGRLFGTSGYTRCTGIYCYDNNTLTQIYDSGLMWDIIVEDENGCTFSSKYDPSQGSVYYNYSTGECTAVAN